MGAGLQATCCSPPPSIGRPMSASLVGSVRVRRHPHRHARSASQCGVSHGPRAYRVRVPINSSGRFGCSGKRIDLGYPLEFSEIFLPMM